MNNLLTRKEMADVLNWSLKKLDRMVRENKDRFPKLVYADGTILFPDGDVLKKFEPDPEREKEPEAAPPPDPFEEEPSLPAVATPFPIAEGETPVYDDTPKPKPKAPAKKPAAKRGAK